MLLLRLKKAAERPDLIASHWPLQRAVGRFLIIKSVAISEEEEEKEGGRQNIRSKHYAMRAIAVI